MTITDIDEAADIKEMCESVPTASNLKLNRAVNPVVTCHHCGKSMLQKILDNTLSQHTSTSHLQLYAVIRN